MKSASSIKALARKINANLKKIYPDATCTLNYSNQLELLVATILSAQCTDKRVNQVTPELFKKYKSAKAYALADLGQLQEYIYSTGFYKNKADTIKNSATVIWQKYNQQVPDDLDKLIALPGIGRKTANVVLGHGFNKAVGVVVDTHVLRITQRLHLVKNTTPEKVEAELIDIIPRKDWVTFSHRIIEFGRQFCKARTPNCIECPLEKLCQYSNKNK
ncbi:MAG: endonuclease III [Nitrospinota bacterium]